MQDSIVSVAHATSVDLNGDPLTATLDAGEQNCATLIMNVRKALASLEAGQILQIVAYDQSAHLDLLAWSRMTGHHFLGMEDHDTHAIYYLRKREARYGEDSGLR